MLKGIFGKKSDHPLADIRSVQKLLDEMPKNDRHKVLMDLAELVASVTEHTDFKLDHQLAVLSLLDEAAQPHVRKLTEEYFSPHELNAFQESRLWLVLGNFSRLMAIAYCAVFDRYCNDVKGSSYFKAQLPLTMVRAVSSMTGQLKYICAHYELVEYSIWENLAKIFTFAEQHGLLDTQVKLYAGSVGNSTVKSQVGRLLGWFGSGVHTLSPVHMHLTECVITQFCFDIEVRSQINETSILCFDLNDPDAPDRSKLSAATVTPTTRFVNMSAMLPKLEGLLKTLEKNIIPEEIYLGGSYGAELVKEAVRHLMIYSISPPVRRSVRRVIEIDYNVESSFAAVVQSVKEGRQFSKSMPVWLIENISTNGFLTVLPAQSSDDIRIGNLLGMLLDGVPHWGVAVVRRMLRSEAYEMHVGAEILSSQVAAVALTLSGGGSGGGIFEDGQLALWLYAKSGEAAGEVQLLMRAGVYSSNRSLQTSLDGKSYLLIPNGLQEKYLDCDLARFRMVEQESVGGQD